ncbi:hypothetical protein NC653_032079 [Populus alba x Populus x berolinensis]|uniref:Uncharacterized protein n=1 Tax=Populus alba x Populus x berolinensis TaxID=444605 RepID=A0AAD6PYN1_9ROSI|nr:hypothetical protein NC653_032079 [Populus alba x Populus x berolinensis]
MAKLYIILSETTFAIDDKTIQLFHDLNVVIGVVSRKAIFGPQLDEYWKKKLVEEAFTKGTDTSST